MLFRSFTSQIDRDERIMSLVATMTETYEFAWEARNLLKNEKYRKHFVVMFRQTTQTGHFIESYTKKKFGSYGFCVQLHFDNLLISGMRALGAVMTPVDKIITDFEEKFKEIKESFKSTELLDVRITVYSMTDVLRNLGVY